MVAVWWVVGSAESRRILSSRGARSCRATKRSPTLGSTVNSIGDCFAFAFATARNDTRSCDPDEHAVSCDEAISAFDSGPTISPGMPVSWWGCGLSPVWRSGRQT